MVDDAREINSEQATGYQETGKRLRLPGAKRSAAAAVTSARPKAAVTTAEPRIYVRLQDSTDQDILRRLKQTIDEHSGSCEVVLVLGSADNRQIIKLPARMQSSDNALDKLRTIVGSANIKLQ